jgi:uncharacterized RDD family membrane protein YckC
VNSYDTSLYPQDSFQGSGSQSEMEYAGFWRRFVAFFIDSIILGVILGAVNYGISMFLGSTFDQAAMTNAIMMQNPQDSEAMLNAMMTVMAGPMVDMLFVTSIASFLVYWLYFAGFESSNLQATPGKSVMGIIVTDVDGDQASFGLATGRALGKYLSSLILYIGYLMIAFTKKKQGLHDKIAGTLVIRKPRY